MTTLFLIVALTLAGVGVYITKKDPKWGTPILVGVGILTALYILWDHDKSQTAVPPSPSPTSASVPTPGLPQGQPGDQIQDGSSPPPATPSWSPTAVPVPLPGK